MPLLIFTFSFISLGNISCFRAYIAGSTFSNERTKYLSIAAAFQTLGMTVGPGLQAALSPLQCSEPSIESYISLDMFTTAGYVTIYVIYIRFFYIYKGKYIHIFITNNEIFF